MQFLPSQSFQIQVVPDAKATYEYGPKAVVEHKKVNGLGRYKDTELNALYAVTLIIIILL